MVHTVMDKTEQKSFVVRVWNGTKIATVTAKKQPQTSCVNGLLYCFTTLNFTSQLNLAVAEIGDSLPPDGSLLCVIRFETTQKNMQCNHNKLKQGSIYNDTLLGMLVLKTETKNMTGGAVFYQNKLVGVIAYKDKAIEIAKLW